MNSGIGVGFEGWKRGYVILLHVLSVTKNNDISPGRLDPAGIH
jgi:hypothetical protein